MQQEYTDGKEFRLKWYSPLRWKQAVYISVRWSSIGRRLWPVTYPTLAEWFGGNYTTFNPDRERRYKKQQSEEVQ